MKITPISLLELNKELKSCIKQNFTSYWLTAEISEISVNYSGHCYLEFIQKDEQSDAIIARSRAVIWSNAYRMIKPYFETTTGQNLTEGINVMVRVKPEFHEIYGLSLNVVDIEPTYTVGELAVRKQKIIEKLKKEGVFEMNKELPAPYLIKNIAVISSKTAAGLEDFVNQLSNNPHGFKFNFKIFPAVMQGNEAESSIIRQLDIIFEKSHLFDAVVIIRGGGAQADLNCFNSYWLAYNITQFSLPVFTGIGHEQDDTVVDRIAHTRLKTPTAVAEFLIDRMAVVEQDLIYTQEKIIDYTRDIILNQKYILKEKVYKFQNQLRNSLLKHRKEVIGLTHNYRTKLKLYLFKKQKKINQKYQTIKSNTKNQQFRHNYVLNQDKENIRKLINTFFTKQNHNLEISNQIISHSNPKNILKKGYSITMREGQLIKITDQLKTGDEIITNYFKGKTISKIKEIQ